ncbi:MAG: endo-1,4-beta-xylanase [Spirochaetaceae bacterium]|jgi:GH35 family endo-1,4-beta-xylanase|nr:endo-1,4-beta-xylanase [Spirochaetaceae bacterium]
MDTFQNRKSRVRIRVRFADAQPVAGRTVHICQKSHQFLFGCGGFDALKVPPAQEAGAAPSAEEQRLNAIFSFNNYATLPFYWGRYEPEEGKPEKALLTAAARYFASRNIAVKGHPLCWHTVCAPWLMQYSNAQIFSKLLARITREITDFKGLIDRWDVLNEGVIMPIFDKYDNALTRICKERGRVRLIKEVFTAAKQANPQATLLLNDFNTTIEYELLLDGCLQAGAPIDVIGIQSHQHQGYWGKEKVAAVLERFSVFGLPLHFTENTLISGELMPAHIVDLNDWQVESWASTPEGEERQKQQTVEMYEILFAHPLVEAITTWNPSDHAWLNAPAGFLRLDNSEKPVYSALKHKIEKEWHTEEAVLTSAEGAVELEGFRGSYELSLAGTDKKAAFYIDGKNPVLEVYLPA